MGKLLPDNQLGLTPPAAETFVDGSATPYFSPMPIPPEDNAAIGDGDKSKEKDGEDVGEGIPPADLHLSDQAAAARLRRACTPNSRGEYKVPQQVIDQYADPKDGRLNLMRQFEKCGYDSDRGLTSLFYIFLSVDLQIWKVHKTSFSNWGFTEWALSKRLGISPMYVLKSAW